MPQLTRALEQIEQRHPSSDSFWRPQLSLQDIGQLTAEYPYQLPKEVIELYLWRNGNKPIPNENGPCLESSFCFTPLPSTSTNTELLSLKKVMEFWLDYNSSSPRCISEKDTLSDHELTKEVMLFVGGRIGIMTVGSREQQDTAPVYLTDGFNLQEDAKKQPFYPSLTNMILMLNEIQKIPAVSELECENNYSAKITI